MDLCYGEQLVLWSLRKWLQDRTAWPFVEQEFWLACGLGQARRALGGFAGLVISLNRRGRRILNCHPLTNPCITPDEQAIVALVAAAQWSRQAHVEAALRWLVRQSAATQAAAHATDLGHALFAAGHVLPLRERAVPDRPVRQAAVQPGAERRRGPGC
jgi:hypothetical protein